MARAGKRVVHSMAWVARATLFLAVTAASCSAPAGNQAEGTVIGSSAKPHDCTADALPTCDFTYTLTVRSGGKPRTFGVDNMTYFRCKSGDEWPSCAKPDGGA